MRVKSLNCTGFSEKKINFSCEQCELINSFALVFRRKKNDLSLENSASELKFTRTVQWSMTPLFTEQWSHAPLYNILPHEKQPNAASPKLVVSS